MYGNLYFRIERLYLRENVQLHYLRRICIVGIEYETGLFIEIGNRNGSELMALMIEIERAFVFVDAGLRKWHVRLCT